MPADDRHGRYVNLIEQGARVREHVDLLQWLQGDVQKCLPHAILMAAWGDFEEGAVHHDVVSSMPGVRSYALGTESLPFLLSRLHRSWVAAERMPCRVPVRDFEHFLGSTTLPGSFGHSMSAMRSALVHGISDRRGKNECLYVFLASETCPEPEDAAVALKVLIPSIDIAFRQVTQLPQQVRAADVSTKAFAEEASVLSERETQIMAWVAMGKTNSEIGEILNISGFTVKNHMQRIFQKLNVFNRAQAVSKITRVAVDG
jgi:transcriptional regulator EpsA